MKVFISWSGNCSKMIAKELRKQLDSIFENEDFTCFMSEEDIMSGDCWFEKIKHELEAADLAILCITKENISAPWINFEAGAIALNMQETKIIPFIFGVSIPSHSPLSHYQAKAFNRNSYENMLNDLKNIGNFQTLSEGQFKTLLKDSFNEISSRVNDIMHELDQTYFESDICIYPEEKKSFTKGNLFIGAPMASLKDEYYINFRNTVIELKNTIDKHCEFSHIYYPGEKIDNPKSFDGGLKAIDKNFIYLKSCEHMLIIYPRKVPSSTLTEIGYGIALSKKIVIFCPNRKILPYLLQNADGKINNIKIYTYKNKQHLLEIVEGNGMSLFC
jgi:hypothetical protein